MSSSQDRHAWARWLWTRMNATFEAERTGTITPDDPNTQGAIQAESPRTTPDALPNETAIRGWFDHVHSAFRVAVAEVMAVADGKAALTVGNLERNEELNRLAFIAAMT